MSFNLKISLKSFLYWVIAAPILFFTACGGSEEPEPIVIDPNQIRDLVGIYEGKLVTTLEDFEAQQIGLSRVNDSTVSVVGLGDTRVKANFNMEATDLSIIEDETVVLSIPYQIIGSDTIQGAPIGAEIHGTYDKTTKKLSFAIRVNFFNEEFQKPEVSNEFYEAIKIQ